MYVVKRDGRKEPVMFDKITARVRKLCYGLSNLVDPVKVAMRVIEGLYDGVTTSELDNLAAEIAATLTTAHPDYAKLAARISVSNLHKNTKKSFSETMKDPTPMPPLMIQSAASPEEIRRNVARLKLNRVTEKENSIPASV